MEVPDAQKLNIGDYPWVAALAENGETVVSYEEAKEYARVSGQMGFFAIQMPDDTIKYVDTDLYSNDLTPGIAYMKAKWVGDFSFGDKAYAHVVSKAYPILQKAVADKGLWIALNGPADVNALQSMRQESHAKNFEVEQPGGSVERYTLLYLNANHTVVN